MPRLLFFVLLLISIQPTVAHSDDGPSRDNGYYFNKPNATVAQVDSDSAECAELVKGTSAKNYYTPQGLDGALIGGIANGLANAKTRVRNFETCMLIKGWRQVYLTSAQVIELKSNVEKNRSGALAAITGVEPVTFGAIGQTWRNNYAEPVVLKKGER